MQAENEKLLSIAIGKVLKKLREKTGKSLTLFCYEYSIPTSSLNDIESGKPLNPKFTTIIQVLRAYGLNYSEFFKIVEQELPADFMVIKD